MSSLDLFIKVQANAANAIRQFGALTSQIEKMNKAGAATRAVGEHMLALGAGIAAVGAGIGYGLWKVTDAAMKGEDATRHMMTAFDLSAPAAEQAAHLAKTLEMVKSVSQATGISQDMLKDSVYNAKMMMLSDAQANDVAAASAKLAIGTTRDFAAAQAAQADVSLMLATSVNVLGGSAKDLSDKFALLQSHYGFKSITDLSSALNYALPAMKGVKTEAGDVFAAMAVLSTSGFQAERIGTGMNELIAKLTTGKSALRNLVIANKEGGPDIERTTQRLAQMTAGMSGLQRASYLKTLGFNLRDVQVMETLLDGVKKFAAARADMAKSGGTTDLLANLRSQGAGQQWAKMWNNFAILQETIGSQLLPGFNSLILLINRALIGITNFAESHKPLVKFLTTFAAMAAGLGVVVGGAIALGGALLVVASFGSTIVTAVAAIAGISLAIAGVVAAVAAWSPKIFDAGLHLIRMLAEGMLSGMTHPIRAIETIGEKLMSYLPHSPAKEGPLRNLHRIKIVEELSRSIQPSVAVTAMRRVALATAMAGALAMPSAASARSGSAVAPATINITINVAGDVTEKNASYFVDLLKKELASRSRTDF